MSPKAKEWMNNTLILILLFITVAAVFATAVDWGTPHSVECDH